MIGRGPTIVTVQPSNNGIRCCCCCTCCSCLNLGYVRSQHGLVRVAEIGLGFFCQSLALNYGLKYSGTLGPSFQSFITTASWCLMTTFLLFFCYVVNEKSISLIRQSLFETVFNSVAAFCYITSCSYLGYAVNMFLEPMYLITPHFQVYPAMSAAYVVGSFLGVIYAWDAYTSYKYFRGYRF